MSGAVRTKPKLRGVSHLVAAFGALLAGAWLVVRAPAGPATVGCAIYAAGLFLMFAISAVYHVPTWSTGHRQWLRRADHAAIFILIAATCTPLCVLVLGPEQGRALLLTIWIAAGLGIIQALFWVHAPKPLSAALYLAVGWLAAPYVGELARGLGSTGVALIVAGGALYSIGAIIYGLRRPDPFPAVFGYHEIFHALVIVASGLHYLAILGAIEQAR